MRRVNPKQSWTRIAGTLAGAGLTLTLFLTLLGTVSGAEDLGDRLASSVEGGVTVIEVVPVGGSHSAALDTSLTITFDGEIRADSLTPQTLFVHGDHHGWMTGSITQNVNSVAYAPAMRFSPGEVIQATVSSKVLDATGAAIDPYVWQFRTKTGPASATFLAGSPFGRATSTSVTDVTLGDVNGDGALDVIVSKNWSGRQEVWLNDGFGGFGQTAHDVFGGQSGEKLALGDVDGDGDLDAVIANFLGVAQGVWVNNGTGTFGALDIFGGSDSVAVALGDVDGDGDLDAVFANRDAPTEVWLNNGQGKFGPTSHDLLGSDFCTDVALGDMDGDGDLDIVVGRYDFSKVWLNDGKGDYGAVAHDIFGDDKGHSKGVALGDLDGDGDLDAVLANRDGAPQSVWLNDGNGTFPPFAHDTFGGGDSYSVTLGDVDGDGDLDIAVASLDQPQEIWLNDGAGDFGPAAQATFSSAGSWHVALGDMDGDTDLDAVVAIPYAGQRHEVWLNQPIISPQMAVMAGEQVIPNGDSTPNPTDGTDFGRHLIDSAAITHTFSIHNTGSADLVLDGSPLVSLTHSSPFSITSQPSSTQITVGQPATFTIAFETQRVGTFTDTVSIPNNDPGENPYTFVVSGTVFPVMADLAVSHSVQIHSTHIHAMSALTFTITGQNRGPQDAHGATISDTLPSGLLSARWTCQADLGAVCGTPGGDGPVTDTLGVFPVGGVVTYTVTGSAVPPGRMESTAQIMPPVGIVDPVLGNNRATAMHDVAFLPTVSKLFRTTSGATRLVSHTFDGSPGQGSTGSHTPSISRDGRFVVYASDVSNLVSDDANGLSDVFLYDRVTEVTFLVSKSAAGVQGNGHADLGVISGDGNVIAFRSTATNLVESAQGSNLFLVERLSGAITNMPTAVHVDEFSLSDDGRFVAYTSELTAHLYDRTTGEDEIFLDCSPGNFCGGLSVFEVANPLVSADGKLVASDYIYSTGFHSQIKSDTIFVDRHSGDTSTLEGIRASVSADWRYVAVQRYYRTSYFDNSVFDVRLEDRQTGEKKLVSKTYDGHVVSGEASSISGDGRFVAFVSDAPGIMPGDTNGQPDVFVYDRTRDQAMRVSVSSTGEQATLASGSPMISGDGSVIVFNSSDSNLTMPPTNGLSNIYIHEPDYTFLDKLPTSFDCQLVQDVPQSECEALVSFHDALLIGSQLNGKDFDWGWPYGVEACGWLGVSCTDVDGGKSVSKIEAYRRYRLPHGAVVISQPSLTGTLPSGLENLPSLRVLALNGYWSGAGGQVDPPPAVLHQLTGGIPDSFGALTNLEALILSLSELAGALPRSLINLTDLNEFRFGGTVLCIPQDAEFQAWLSAIPDVHSSGLYCD